jgi:ABC-2 type transport system ATP-binding protein
MAAPRQDAYRPDRPVHNDKLPGAEFLRFVAGLWGFVGAAVDRRSAELLEMFGLTRWADTLVESYSHGMRQKLLISSALVHSPDLIVVDEPMVGLDPKGARLIKDLLRAFTEQGGTVFLSTHTLEVAESLCDRIAILEGGRIRAIGSMEELRAASSAGSAGLEEVFLRLTGGADVADLVSALRAAGPRGGEARSGSA